MRELIPPMEIGHYDGVANSVYHSWDCPSSTWLKAMEFDPEISPAHLLDYLTTPQESTEAMEFGTDVHTAVLEPDRFDREYVVGPKVDRRTKEGKATWAAFVESSQGKRIITADNMEVLRRIAENCRKHPFVSELLNAAGVVERSFVFKESESGVVARVRVDKIADGICCLDLKTCGCGSIEDFTRDCWTYKQHVSAGLYRDCLVQNGIDLPHYYLVCEKSPPFWPRVVEVETEVVQYGQYRASLLLRVYRRCKDSGIWPGYGWQDERGSYAVDKVGLPAWQARRVFS